MESVIKTAIGDVLQELDIDEVDFVVEHPAELSHGDYACNVAMVISQKLGKNPREIAEELVGELAGEIEYVDKIEVAGPGFINFYLARDFFVEEITRIHNLGDDWGKNTSLEGEQILLEYTSPNLFKPLHVGNLVGNIIGESLARLYVFSGANVKRINYPSDIGLTVAKGVWGLQKTGGNPEDITALGEAYRVGNEAFENDEALKKEIEAVNRSLYEGDDEVLATLRAKGIKTSRAHLAELCRMLGTTFDYEIFESEAGPKGKELVEAHRGTIFQESDGAIVYKGEQDGLHTRVFLNSQGLPTYEAKDLGNFGIKQEQYPDWRTSIIVTGNEQLDYFKVEYAVIRKVFNVPPEKNLVHIPTGFLTLSTGKMSSRKGNVLTGESVLEEMVQEAFRRMEESGQERGVAVDQSTGEAIAVAALKYQILKHNLGSDIVFDKEKALSFEGDSGPYLQYTHARIQSVAQKAQTAGIGPSVTSVPQVTYEIEKILYRFEEVIEEVVAEDAPQKLVTYLTELASSFNSFYAQEKIADVEDEFAPYKLAVAKAVQQTLKNGLHLLGVEAPERM